jgi:error-prone DNA polymerase
MACTATVLVAEIGQAVLSNKSIILSGMKRVRDAYGRIQREGEVVHLVAHRLADLSGELASIGDCDVPFPIPHGHGDGAKHGGAPDSREVPVRKDWDIHIPDQQFDKIRAKTRDSR